MDAVVHRGDSFSIAPGLADAPVLAKEMQTFRVKVTTAGNETFESWRERDHDDEILAVAMALWFCERQAPYKRFWIA
jgi:hypothetical protein